MDYLQEKSLLVEELVGGTKLFHIFIDEKTVADTSISVVDMSDGDFDNFLTGVNKEIDILSAKFEQYTDERLKIYAELEEMKHKFNEMQHKCDQIKKEIQESQRKRDVLVKHRTTYVSSLQRSKISTTA